MLSDTIRCKSCAFCRVHVELKRLNKRSIFVRSTWWRSSNDIYGYGRRPFSVHRSKNIIGNICLSILSHIRI